MLQRHEMWRPGAGISLGMNAGFTDVQEQKQAVLVAHSQLFFELSCVCLIVRCLDMGCPWQACGGTSFLTRLKEDLVAGTSVNSLAIVDVHGYDGWPAMAVLEAAQCFLPACLDNAV